MSIRLKWRRSLIGLAAVIAVSLLAPAGALAAASLSVAPASTQAGSSPAITDTLNYAPGSMDTPKQSVVNLAPGLLANENANPSCVAVKQLNSNCQIGTASVVINGSTTIPGTIYLVPAESPGDAAGIETVASPLPDQYTGITIANNGAATLTTNFPDSRSIPVYVDSVTLSLDSTLNGKPLNRLPTYCSSATSTMSVTYYGSTPSVSNTPSSFTPTGCGTLPYAPNFSASATKEGSGAAVTVTTTQTNGEAANRTVQFTIPPGLLSPNPASIGLFCSSPTFTGCTSIGNASAVSPLIPVTLSGKVYLTGTVLSPLFEVAFPSPDPIRVVGSVSASTGKVTFDSSSTTSVTGLPDISLTSLTVALNSDVFTASCAPSTGTVTGTFTDQNSDRTVNRSDTITVKGCPLPQGKPTVKGSVGGLAKGHPKLHFVVTHGKNAPGLASVSVGVPGGLAFSRKAFVTHRRCTGKGRHRKCRTTLTIKGLAIAGGSVKSVRISGGRLVIALKRAAGSLSVTTAGPLLVESKALRRNVQKHRVKALTFKFTVVDAKHKSTALSLKLKAS